MKHKNKKKTCDMNFKSSVNCKSFYFGLNATSFLALNFLLTNKTNNTFTGTYVMVRYVRIDMELVNPDGALEWVEQSPSLYL